MQLIPYTILYLHALLPLGYNSLAFPLFVSSFLITGSFFSLFLLLRTDHLKHDEGRGKFPSWLLCKTGHDSNGYPWKTRLWMNEWTDGEEDYFIRKSQPSWHQIFHSPFHSLFFPVLSTGTLDPWPYPLPVSHSNWNLWEKRWHPKERGEREKERPGATRSCDLEISKMTWVVMNKTERSCIQKWPGWLWTKQKEAVNSFFNVFVPDPKLKQ